MWCILASKYSIWWQATLSVYNMQLRNIGRVKCIFWSANRTVGTVPSPCTWLKQNRCKRSVVLTGEDSGEERDVLVHTDGVIEWNVDVKKSVSQKRDDVSTHCHKQRSICEHHSAGRSTSHAHSVAADTTQTGLFPLDRKDWQKNERTNITNLLLG